VTKAGIYAGTENGLAWTPSPDTPLTVLGLSGGSVRALAIDPSAPESLWAASSTGLMFSPDGGRTWISRGGGLKQPGAVQALGYFGDRLYTSDGTGVFAWEGSSASWVRSSSQPGVVDLSGDPQGDTFYASSVTAGVWRLSSGGWQALGEPAASHQHHGHVHGGLSQLLASDGRLYASGTSDGVSASADGGLTWTQLGGGLPADTPPTDVIRYKDSLLAANPYGLYRFPLSSSTPATISWWLVLVAAAMLAGAVALLISAPERVRPLFMRRPPGKIGSQEAGAVQSAPSPQRQGPAGGG
jgi:hypothetical protein